MRLHVNYPLSQISIKLEFLRQIFQKQISNFLKIHPVGSELFLANAWTDMTKLTVVFEMFQTRLKTKNVNQS